MSKNDEKIKALLAAVEKQKEAMGKRPKVSFETNGLFKFPDGNHFNLNTVSDTDQLIKALTILISYEDSRTKAAEILGINGADAVWNGFSVKDWEKDFIQQAKVIAWRKQKTKLDALNKKLGELMSEDARTASELADIEKLLG